MCPVALTDSVWWLSALMLLFLVVTHGELQERFLSVLNSVMGSLNGSLTRLLKRSCFRLNIIYLLSILSNLSIIYFLRV